MEILVEVLLALGQIVAEILLQAVFEIIGEFGLHALREPFRQQRPLHPWLAGVGYGIFGAAAGGLSLLLLPSSVIGARWLRILNLAITPVAVGLVMSALGAWRRRRGQQVIRLDRFGYGFVFALCMAVVRFIWADG